MKRTIGIDINKYYISLAQLCCKRGRYYLEKSHVHRMSDSDSSNHVNTEQVHAIIKNTITNENFDFKAPVIISMPYGRVFFHNFKTEFSSDKDIERLIKYELEDDFPISFDDLVTNICSSRNINESQKELLVGAVKRSELQNWTQIINETGLSCSLVTSEISALYDAAKLNHDLATEDSSIIMHVDSSRAILGVYQKDSLISVRYIDNIKTDEMVSLLEQEITLTLKAVSDTKNPLPSKIFLSGNHNLVLNIKKKLPKEINSEIVISDPFIKIIDKSEQKKNNKLVIAIGLALIGLEQSKNVFNFLAADKAEAVQVNETKRNVLSFAVLAVAFAALLLVNFFSQLKGLEKENESLEKQIRDVFVKTLPEEKKIVNELAQMNDKYIQLEKEYNVIASETVSRVPAIKILNNISQTITPDLHIGVTGISMTPGSVLFSGIAADFETLDNIVEMLQETKDFDSVEIQNVDLNPKSSNVPFSLLIKFDMDN
ncbi:MAG: pilus assembly protein PilM [Sedimentisphaerales bacterium]|nr:pilus assembly protein PilM [Sedimentisphaerales bacterium]